MRTYYPAEVERKWLLVDLDGKTLGRAASVIAVLLRGKHKPEFTPSVDTGDHVVAINASKIKLTGNKLSSKRYYRHSGYPGGLREIAVEDLMARRPQEVIRLAVKGMLPKNSLARKALLKLKIYPNKDHPHQAQRPTPHQL